MTDVTSSGLEDVIITGDLARRCGRAPCYEGESSALAEIAESMANAPETVLQQLAEKAMKLTRSESAGISLLEDIGGIETFRWVATAGAFTKNLGDTMPRHESPCGLVVDRNDLLLFHEPVRLFPAIKGCEPHIHEVLLAPLSIEGETVGTVWALKHCPEGRFDAEDARLLQSLARFASAGARAVEARRATEALRDEKAAERARADARLTAEMEAARTLQDLSRRLLSADQPNALYERVVEVAMTLMKSDAASMQIVDSSGARLELVASRGLHPRTEAFWQWVDASSETACGGALRAAKRVTVPEVETSDSVLGAADLDEFRRSGLRAVQSTPLVTRNGKLVGMISTHWSGPRSFAEAEFALFDVLARQAADLVERTQTEVSLRESEERQRFLLKLADRQRLVSDPTQVMNVTAEMFALRLGVAVAHFLLVEPDGDSYRLGGSYSDGRLPMGMAPSGRLSDHRPEWGPQFRAGEAVFSDAYEARSSADAEAFRGLGVQCGSAVPLIREGQMVAIFSTAHPEPRQWTDAEKALQHEVADRTWAAVERARAEAFAREAEGRYLALFDAIDQGFCTIEVEFDENMKPVDYRFLEVSPSFERLTGIENAAGRRMREIAPDQDQFWFDTYGRVARTGEPARFESFATALDRWWSVYAFKIEGEDRIAAIFHDITDRKRAEEEIARREQQFETLLDHAPLGVYLVDGDFMIRQVNPIASPVFGDIPGGPVGRDFDEVMHVVWAKEYADEVVRIFRHTLETGETYVTAERAEHRSDRDNIEYYEWRLDRIILPDGRYGVVCYFRDISAQVHARKEIEKARDFAHESEERLRLIVENAQDYAIFTTDPDGIVIDWLAGAETVFGYTGEEMTGKSCNSLFVPEDRQNEQLVKERATAAEHGKASDVRWHLRKDGSRVFMDGVSTALRDPDGRLVGFLKIAQDVTERHAADERQRLLLAELQHRVRNILAMIRSVARRTAETSDTVREYAQHLEGRIDAMARTQAILTREPGSAVDLEGIVQSELLSVAAQEDKVWCEGPAVCLEPKAAEILTLAIHELVTNAVKYGAFSQPAGQLEIRWEVEDRGADDWLVFTWEEARVEGVLLDGREGFGTELITRRVPYELGGSGTYELRPGGIRTVIECPLRGGSSILETGVRGLGEAA